MKDSDEELSCTSVLCQWKAPRANAKPQPMSALAHRKPSTDSTNDPMTEPAPHPQTTFDPRHSMDRIPYLDRTLQHLQKLEEIFPKTGMVHIWNIPDPVPMASHEEEIVTTKDPYIMKMEEMLFTVGSLPPPSIDMDLVMFIEKYTQEQRKYTNMPASVQWGIDDEDTARVEYSMMKQVLGGSFRIDSTGLMLCSTHTFLGASSDGRVTEENSTGVLEIKCPYSIKGTLVNAMEIPDILAMEDKCFCLENTSEGPNQYTTE
ncbi:uncharacterized protein LOC125663038 [Ostrea edulis]|uniref:uncharacterized protein LOC125663038 n=1 Tax=Ostrea edulis TaxID=37623 RepID=UPI0024AE9E45|nr:uncharacterized protein LOC125663038 [Ostrea edulis]